MQNLTNPILVNAVKGGQIIQMAVIIFGLNALNGRVPLRDGSLGGPWNYTNAAALIRYTSPRDIHWQQGITLLLINLSGTNSSTTPVFVTTQTAYSAALKQRHGAHRTRFNHIPRLGKTSEFTREEYHLTAEDGDIHSQTVLLNGNILAVDSDGNIPELEPVAVDATQPITVAPFSIVFAHIPYFYAPACRSVGR
ncbi:hypothetical protein BHE74_00035274 [Ensete ventricosum]|nr:hypothetical protein BHE74_00035274 [Ensete ventricosum]